MIKLKELLSEQKIYLVETTQISTLLGFPPIIDELWIKNFGKNAFLLAKWYKDYHNYGNDKKDWWRNAFLQFTSRLNIVHMVDLYNSTRSPEEYHNMLQKLDLSDKDFILFRDSGIAEDYIEKQKPIIRNEIEEMLLKDVFFVHTIVKAITQGQLKDLRPYKNLSFKEAEEKYNQFRLFKQLKPIREYSNGYRWIDVGRRCELVGNRLKNCGSVSLMSSDSKATMIALFDDYNNPHVVVTYSPTEGRISGDQGGASTAVKPEYMDYVLDLVKFLGADFDFLKTDSHLLKLKYLLRKVSDDVTQIKGGNTFDHYFKFTIDGKKYYSDSFYAVSAENIKKIVTLLKNKKIELGYERGGILKNMFDYRNRKIFQNYIEYIPLELNPYK